MRPKLLLVSLVIGLIAGGAAGYGYYNTHHSASSEGWSTPVKMRVLAVGFHVIQLDGVHEDMKVRLDRVEALEGPTKGAPFTEPKNANYKVGHLYYEVTNSKTHVVADYVVNPRTHGASVLGSSAIGAVPAATIIVLVYVLGLLLAPRPRAAKPREGYFTDAL